MLVRKPKPVALRRTLQYFLDSPSSRAGRLFHIVIQASILISIVSFSIETLPSLSAQTRHHLEYIEAFCVAAFSAEYLLRVYAAPSRRKYIFSFLGLIDALAIAPFFLSLTIDLRSLRIVRLLRLLQAIKALRYSATVNRMLRAVWSIHRELAVFGVACSIVLYIAAVGIYYCERNAQPEAFASVFHAMWWAVATLTTVGYGDVYPVTALGKLFTAATLLVGLGVVAIPSGLFATALSNTPHDEGIDEVSSQRPCDDSSDGRAVGWKVRP